MGFNLAVESKDTASVEIFHPGTRERLAVLIVAGPDHQAFKDWRREIVSRKQKRNYRPDPVAEIKESLIRRTVGWEGVKDNETGEAVPFDKKHLDALYDQDWLVEQVLSALGDDDFFFKE
jgi:hypothetical protein